MFSTVGFCHRWCSSQKKNCTPPRCEPTSACLGLSFTLCEISTLPWVLGLLLQTLFPFLRRWWHTWQLEGGGYGPACRIVEKLNDAADTILEPEMSSACLGINARLTMSERRV